VEGELRGRGRDPLFDQGGLEPDAPVLAIHAGACGDEQVDRPVAENLDPDLGQDPERSPMDLLNVVGRQNLERSEGVRQRPERELRDAAARPAHVSPMGDRLDRHAPSRASGLGNIG
jgi:hypothetical protein